MSRDALHFEELQIRRAPGFDGRGFTISGLTSGVNLIHGPNGVGKSTAARAITQLLWQDGAGERLSLHGRFRLGSQEWSAEIDGSRRFYRRGGVESPPPPLPAGEDHRRYHLSLHDLLRERDESFAAAVLRESAGGFDVRASGAVLGPRVPVSRRDPNRNDALDDARKAHREAEARQGELQQAEARLAELRLGMEEAKAALERVAVLELALERARARDREASARAEYERHDVRIARLVGNEEQQLRRFRDRLHEIAHQGSVTLETREQIRAEVADALPDAAAAERLLPALEHDLADLRAAEQEVATADQHCAAARGRAEYELRLIEALAASDGGWSGDSVDPGRVAWLDGRMVARAADFARRAGEFEAQRQALEARVRALTEAEAEADPRQIERGIHELNRWLRAPLAEASEGWMQWLPHLGAILLIVLGVALAVRAHPVFFLITVVGGALLWPLLGLRSGPTAAPTRAASRREFERLGLEAPPAWEENAVEQQVASLQERSARAYAAADTRRRRAELLDELQRLDGEVGARIRDEALGLAAMLGAPVAMSVEGLTLLVGAVSRWQGAYSEQLGAEAARDEAIRRAAMLHDSLRERLAPLGYGGLVTSGEIAASLNRLRERLSRTAVAREKLQSVESRLRTLHADRRRVEQDIQRLFESAGLKPNDDDLLIEWCRGRDEFLRLRDAYREAESQLRFTHTQLRTCTSEEDLAELVQATVAELEMQIAAGRELGAARDRYLKEITQTEERIDHAKRAHDVEEALERIERAEEALREARDRDVRAIIAHELIDYLERATRDQQLPAVFRRAQAIFTRITHGRYELRIPPEGSPEFTARDTVEGVARTLDELSSGTRVQLLLAVRVAFAEEQEQGTMLPLVLDEALGNSDDERARAVMEAVVELAREGRQIFYLTAQADEVARWRALSFGDAGVTVNEIDLQRVRGLGEGLKVPDARYVLPPAMPAAPNGLDHPAYGRRLGVPRLDRATQTVGGLHLWYLVEDLEVLHRLLSLRTERWGQLSALVGIGGRPLVDSGSYREMELYAAAAEAFLEAARVGVGRPVDRAALEDSRAISPVFIDRVDEVARSLGGNAAELMDALEGRRVPGFREASKEALREYLVANGYLPTDAALGPEEVWRRVLGATATEIRAGLVAPERLERMAWRLWAGLGGESPLGMS